MIPKNIIREHVLKAIQQIDTRTQKIPPEREATKYCVLHNSTSYPPKYLISLANKFANGKELDAHTFNGGSETNRVLKRLGFEVRAIADPKRKHRPVTTTSEQKERGLVDFNVTSDDLARWRRRLMPLIDKLDGGQNQDQGLVSRIRSLSSSKRIPRHVAACMTVIVEVRNASEHRLVHSAFDRAAAQSCWVAVMEWARSKGTPIPDG